MTITTATGAITKTLAFDTLSQLIEYHFIYYHGDGVGVPDALGSQYSQEGHVSGGE